MLSRSKFLFMTRYYLTVLLAITGLSANGQERAKPTPEQVSAAGSAQAVSANLSLQAIASPIINADAPASSTQAIQNGKSVPVKKELPDIESNRRPIIKAGQPASDEKVRRRQ
jgi:hypothetical protein